MTASLAAAEPAYLPYYVVMDPPIVYPGAVVRLQVRAPRDASTGTVTIAGRRFQGEIANGVFTGFFAVDIDTLPGPYELRYDIGSRSGTRVVTVRARRFDDAGLWKGGISREDQAVEELTVRNIALLALWSRTNLTRLWNGGFRTPVGGGNIHTPFGVRRTDDERVGAPHTAVDLVGGSGETVVASNWGTVALVGQAPNGKFVAIDHGLGLYTFYSGLGEVAVEQGRSVNGGTAIGRMPQERSVLHFGARLGGAHVDPITLPGIDLKVPDLPAEARRQPKEERFRTSDYDY
ncbi:MAG TPA: M23 family metallopeptidase [Candidatus Limnocylindrales bacterium]|nr:M23 family metallopeptidase [Candidatus Limnocylindrales bacterium]